MNDCFTCSFIILGNSGESRSYNDDDEHRGIRVRLYEYAKHVPYGTICAIIDDQARGGRGKRR